MPGIGIGNKDAVVAMEVCEGVRRKSDSLRGIRRVQAKRRTRAQYCKCQARRGQELRGEKDSVEFLSHRTLQTNDIFLTLEDTRSNQSLVGCQIAPRVRLPD